MLKETKNENYGKPEAAIKPASLSDNYSEDSTGSSGGGFASGGMQIKDDDTAPYTIEDRHFSELSPRDARKLNDAIASGALIVEDNSEALDMLSKFLKAYMKIPDEALDTALLEEGKRFEDPEYHAALRDLISMAREKPYTRGTFWKAFKNSPELGPLFKKRMEKTGWKPPEEDDTFDIFYGDSAVEQEKAEQEARNTGDNWYGNDASEMRDTLNKMKDAEERKYGKKGSKKDTYYTFKNAVHNDIDTALEDDWFNDPRRRAKLAEDLNQTEGMEIDPSDWKTLAKVVGDRRL